MESDRSILAFLINKNEGCFQRWYALQYILPTVSLKNITRVGKLILNEKDNFPCTPFKSAIFVQNSPKFNC